MTTAQIKSMKRLCRDQGIPYQEGMSAALFNWRLIKTTRESIDWWSDYLPEYGVDDDCGAEVMVQMTGCLDDGRLIQ